MIDNKKSLDVHFRSANVQDLFQLLVYQVRLKVVPHSILVKAIMVELKSQNKKPGKLTLNMRKTINKLTIDASTVLEAGPHHPLNLINLAYKNGWVDLKKIFNIILFMDSILPRKDNIPYNMNHPYILLNHSIDPLHHSIMINPLTII